MVRMTDEMFLKRATEEDGCAISAIGSRPLQATRAAAAAVREPIRIAFGTLINYRRREMCLTIEAVAQKADVNLDAILQIEENSSYLPEPDAVERLANVLQLPAAPMLVLSGNTPLTGTELAEAAVRFAVRSRAVEKLDPKQTDALNEFVTLLSGSVKQAARS